ncbi:hypothetical protein M422DRAFT_207455 [Sphaerobolus stellatus SS14]|uniref:PCI domain-containing protein n=1 Tax=Sphaerobolus stellatus (strain SS14) TaxID=990650 RepID=A0A0C9W2D9_SPHS4|nr:hypothetical protein M422DRAFT_207455 [Sphaerobolus stellatus SS14]
MSDLASASTARLEPFLLMSKSAKGAAAAKLIQDATSANGVFVFAELLDLPNIQELANSPQHLSFYKLLELFSYKTYEDYVRDKDTYPALNAAQISKLKRLSLATYAMTRRILPYAKLQSALDLPSIRALEDVIIDAMYQDIIHGKLDQKQQHFQVEWVMGRDLAPGDLQGLLKGLQSWSNTTASLLTQLDTSIASVQSDQASHKATLDEHATLQQKALGEVIQAAKNAGGHSGSGPALRPRKGNSAGDFATGILGLHGSDDRMDIDEPGAGGPSGWGGRKKAAPDAGKNSSARKRNRF